MLRGRTRKPEKVKLEIVECHYRLPHCQNLWFVYRFFINVAFVDIRILSALDGFDDDVDHQLQLHHHVVINCYIFVRHRTSWCITTSNIRVQRFLEQCSKTVTLAGIGTFVKFVTSAAVSGRAGRAPPHGIHCKAAICPSEAPKFLRIVEVFTVHTYIQEIGIRPGHSQSFVVQVIS